MIYVFDIQTNAVIWRIQQHEKDVSAEQQQEKEDAWVQRAHGDQGRSSCAKEAARQGA